MRPGPRRSLTHAEILDVAFDLLEAKGFAAVSVRGVASGLGLTPTALYTYYPSKNALLRGMVEHLLARLDPGEAGAGDAAGEPAAADAAVEAGAAGSPAAPAAGRDRLLALALRLRELLTGHAGALGLIMSGPLDGPNAMRLNETLLESFMAAGLELDDAARAAYALQVYVLGSIALESADLRRRIGCRGGIRPCPRDGGHGRHAVDRPGDLPAQRADRGRGGRAQLDRAVHVGRAAPARRAHRRCAGGAPSRRRTRGEAPAPEGADASSVVP